MNGESKESGGLTTLLEGGPEPGTTWVTIPFGSAVGLELEIRRPTYEELVADSERFAGRVLARVERHVVGWRGVRRRIVDTTDPENRVEKVEDVPFSVGDFRRLCVKRPALWGEALAAVNSVFRGTGDDALGE